MNKKHNKKLKEFKAKHIKNEPVKVEVVKVKEQWIALKLAGYLMLDDDVLFNPEKNIRYELKKLV